MHERVRKKNCKSNLEISLVSSVTVSYVFTLHLIFVSMLNVIRNKVFITFILFSFLPSLYGEKLVLQVDAGNAILINSKTGFILFEKNAHAPVFPASITKIATALYTLKVCQTRLDEKVLAKQDAIASISPVAKKQSNYRSPAYWLETDSTHMGIKKGEEFVLRDLLYCMLVYSANDASNVIAEHVEGSIPKFVEKMNSYLKEIGCKNTHFCNPHGLHHPQHVTTAYDMAVITREAMKYPLFRKIVSTVRFTCPQTNLELKRPLLQTNLLLRNGSHFYPKAIGVKTGTMSISGKTLVGAAEDENRSLIAVVMGYSAGKGERYDDVIKMFEKAFNEPKLRKHLLPPGPQTLTTKIIGSKNKLKTYLPKGFYYDFFKTEETAVNVKMIWNINHLPIKKDEVVGHIVVNDAKGNVIQEMPCYALDDVYPSFFYKIKKGFLKKTENRKVLFALGAGFFLFFTYRFVNRRKRR